MSNRLRLEVRRGRDDDQKVADAINATLAGKATVTLRRPPSGSLPSIDPTTQSFIIELLNSNALETALELIFIYFIAGKAEKVKVDDVEVDLKSDPKKLAKATVKKLRKK